MNRFADNLTDIGDIVRSDMKNGSVTVAIGDAAKGTGVDAGALMFGPDGFIGRPNDADGDGAATAFYFFSGNRKVVLGTTDRRFASKAGALKPGDRAIVSSGAARFFLKNEDDLIVIYTEHGTTPNATSMVGSFNGSTGEIVLSVGLTQIVISSTKISLIVNGGPSLVLDGTVPGASSIAMTGSTVNVDGGFVTLGLNSDGSRPVVLGQENVIIGPLGVLGLPSPKVLAASH